MMNERDQIMSKVKHCGEEAPPACGRPDLVKGDALTRPTCPGILLAIAILLAATLGGSVLAQDRVKTADGVVEGTLESSGIRTFKGIPFASPPVGDLRWQPPQPIKQWTGVRKADHFGPRCMQRPVFSDMKFRSDGMSEDCLYLNVWTPAKSSNERLPVLVYFYGGGFA